MIWIPVNVYSDNWLSTYKDYLTFYEYIPFEKFKCDLITQLNKTRSFIDANEQVLRQNNTYNYSFVYKDYLEKHGL